MRLIDTRTYEMVEYYDAQIPDYAILSHTWETEEITYQDMQNLSIESRGSRRSWSKIAQACEIAVEHELDFLWVDTCCIDKTNSVELSEAINSMFKWYKESELCIAYLADVDIDVDVSRWPSELTRSHQSLEQWRKDSKLVQSTFTLMEAAIFNARWWKRGWTLQELIAPGALQFYNSVWQDLGSKTLWHEAITRRIGIPFVALYGEFSKESACVAQKFSWAAGRNTSRLEDKAYCLLGLFNVNMPLLYGEGLKAFERLQEEIIKQSNDLTILAHSPNKSTTNLLAESPEDFEGLGGFRARERNRYQEQVELSITKRGLQMVGHAPLYFADVDNGTERGATYFISLAWGPEAGDNTVLCLSKVGAQLFHRSSIQTLRDFKGRHGDVFQGLVNEPADCCILLSGEISNVRTRGDTINDGIFLPPNIKPGDIVPYAPYDRVRRVFFQRRVRYHGDPGQDVVIALKNTFKVNQNGPCHGPNVEFIILCYGIRNHKEPGNVFVFEAAKHPRLTTFLFANVNRESSVCWQLLEFTYPEVQQFSGTVGIWREQKRYDLRASFQSEWMKFPHFRYNARLYSLQVHLTRPQEESTIISNTGPAQTTKI